MIQLISGLILFLGTHSIAIINEPWRNRTAKRIGEWPWKGLYGLISLIGLVLIVRGYGVARLDPTVLYMPPAWLRYVSFLLLLLVFPMLLAAYLPGRIQRTFGHPMLVAVKSWALAHLLVNGLLADVLLFGGFLVWAGADRLSLKYRAPREVPHLREPFLAPGVITGLNHADQGFPDRADAGKPEDIALKAFKAMSTEEPTVKESRHAHGHHDPSRLPFQ